MLIQITQMKLLRAMQLCLSETLDWKDRIPYMVMCLLIYQPSQFSHERHTLSTFIPSNELLQVGFCKTDVVVQRDAFLETSYYPDHHTGSKQKKLFQV